MNTNELYALGEKAFDEERYADAIRYFQSASSDNVDAKAYLPMCYLNLASQVSLQASGSNDTETLVRGQQHAVKLLDTAIRSALNFLKNHGDSLSDCNIAGMVIAQAFNLQYTLVATGLTTAYRLTTTTTTIEKTMMGDTVLWEEITGQETSQYVSLTPTDFHDYHIFGPDEKTKRVYQEKAKVLRNAVQTASILEYLGRPYDAHILRAAVACEMADCENGDRSMLLAADWFVCQGQDMAKESLGSIGLYDEWKSLQDATISTYEELEAKYAALLRSFRREGRKPALATFYQPGETVPGLEACASYMIKAQANEAIAQASGKSDIWEVFLSVFAQAATVRIIPTIVFSSVVSLFMGGLLNAFSADSGAFIKILVIVWMIITLVITFVRTITDSDGISGKNLRLYQLIMFGTAIVFSINFIVGIVALVVLKFLSAKYK